MQKLASSEIVRIRLHVVGRVLLNRIFLLRQQLHLQLFDYGVRDFVLDGEDIGKIAIEPLRPDVLALLGAHQLSRHSHPRARFSHASFKKKLHTELLTNLLHRPWLVFVGEHRVARDNE